MSVFKLGFKMWLSDLFYLPTAALISHTAFETIPTWFRSDYSACIWGTALGTLIARGVSIWFEWVMDKDPKDGPATGRAPRDRAARLPEQARAA